MTAADGNVLVVDDMGRTWLHPRWYIAHWGGMVLTSVRPHHFTNPDDPDPICTECDAVCEMGGYDLDTGYLCFKCGDAKPRPKVTWLKRHVAFPIQGATDWLYWWYCKRFGERIYHDQQAS
jgi:hypothetical protein